MAIEHDLRPDLDRVLDLTRAEWENLRGGRIFITGGTGFIGCWLLETFLEANRRLNLRSEAVVLTRNPVSFREKSPHLAEQSSVRLWSGDVRNWDFPPGEFSHVIHGAAQASRVVNEKQPLEMIGTIIDGTRRIAEFCEKKGVRRLLFLSSGAVYGPQSPTLPNLSEDHNGAPDPADAKAAYGESKRLAEVLCHVANRAGVTQATIARCFALVGPYLPLDIHYAMGNFIRDGLRGGPIVVEGDGTTVRSYLYAADLAVWLWTILFRGIPSRPYNVGSPEPITTAALAGEVAGSFDPRCEVIIKGKTERGRTVDRYVPSVDRAREDLGLRPTYSLRQSIQRTVEWYRAVSSRGREWSELQTT